MAATASPSTSSVPAVVEPGAPLPFMPAFTISSRGFLLFFPGSAPHFDAPGCRCSNFPLLGSRSTVLWTSERS